MDLQVNGIKFREVHGFCPESYEIYEGDKKIGYIKELNSRIRAQIGKEIVYEKMINEHKESIKDYIDDIYEAIRKHLQ